MRLLFDLHSRCKSCNRCARFSSCFDETEKKMDERVFFCSLESYQLIYVYDELWQQILASLLQKSWNVYFHVLLFYESSFVIFSCGLLLSFYKNVFFTPQSSSRGRAWPLVPKLPLPLALCNARTLFRSPRSLSPGGSVCPLPAVRTLCQ